MIDMRAAGTAVLVAVLAAPLGAQAGAEVDAWRVRFDEGAAAGAAGGQAFVAMAPGWHVTTESGGIFWDPRLTGSGNFRAEVDIFLFDPGGMQEGFGIFVGGRDLEGAGQEYTYFLVRDGGQSLIKLRVESETPTLRDWTAHPAIRSYAQRGTESSVLNTIAIEAGPGAVRFLVNGAEVASLLRDEVPTDGVVGLRINHHLNVHVSRLEVTPLR